MQLDARADHQQTLYASRLRARAQPAPERDYYEATYAGHLYPRPDLDDRYPGHPSPSLSDSYGHGGYFYHGYPQDTAPRPGSPPGWHEDPREPACDLEQSRAQLPWQDRVPGPGDIASGTDLLADSLRPGTPGTEPVLPGECDPLTPQEWGSHPSAHDPLQDADPGPGPEQGVSRAGPQDPVKFSAPHVPVGFGPGGLLVLAVPRGGRPELVELHSMEVILYDSEEQEEMRIFSGPLNRDDVYKVDIVTFCQRKAEQSCRAQSPRGQDSALLWKLLVLLCRQNGSMVGSDVADLLMKDCGERGQDQRQPPVADLIGLDGAGAWPVPSPGTPNLLTGETPPSVETPAQVVEKFTKLLYFGRKKEALEYAMKNHLWGHALFLSSKMDSRTYNWVMSGFISTLALNDPLQTFFQLMSGRIPQAATSCGDQQWGDWRPHLAMVLSNQGAEPELQRRTIVTLGDTL
ncbi:protein transport protein Sec16B-like, partial [Sorex fumeus]|uniref:protein transport protein Sec16B-like n=1 Tax=Sorex fumeus TaxID=62283 RepID=UPI0024AE1E99